VNPRDKQSFALGNYGAATTPSIYSRGALETFKGERGVTPRPVYAQKIGCSIKSGCRVEASFSINGKKLEGFRLKEVVRCTGGSGEGECKKKGSWPNAAWQFSLRPIKAFASQKRQ